MRQAKRVLESSSVESVMEDKRLETPAALKDITPIQEAVFQEPVQFQAPASPDEAPVAKRAYRKPLPRGTVVEREILELQQDQEKIIAQLPFARTVRDISMTFSGVNKAGDPKLTWHIDALNALHEAAETYVVELFEDAALCAEHGKRHTLYPEDMQLAQLVRGASSNK